MKRRLVGLSGAALLAACGGPGHFDGTVSAHSLAVREAVFYVLTEPNTPGNTVAVVMSDLENLCQMFKDNRSPKSGSALILGMAQHASGTLENVQPGEFSIVQISAANPPAKFATARFAKSDASCNSVLLQGQGEGNSGKVTLDSYEAKAGGTARGSFDITFGSQSDKGKGSFEAQFCDFTPTTAPSTCT
jgi:hypothetical protein